MKIRPVLIISLFTVTSCASNTSAPSVPLGPWSMPLSIPAPSNVASVLPVETSAMSLDYISRSKIVQLSHYEIEDHGTVKETKLRWLDSDNCAGEEDRVVNSLLNLFSGPVSRKYNENTCKPPSKFIYRGSLVQDIIYSGSIKEMIVGESIFAHITQMNHSEVGDKAASFTGKYLVSSTQNGYSLTDHYIPGPVHIITVSDDIQPKTVQLVWSDVLNCIIYMNTDQGETELEHLTANRPILWQGKTPDIVETHDLSGPQRRLLVETAVNSPLMQQTRARVAQEAAAAQAAAARAAAEEQSVSTLDVIQGLAGSVSALAQLKNAQAAASAANAASKAALAEQNAVRLQSQTQHPQQAPAPTSGSKSNPPAPQASPQISTEGSKTTAQPSSTVVTSGSKTPPPRTVAPPVQPATGTIVATAGPGSDPTSCISANNSGQGGGAPDGMSPDVGSVGFSFYNRCTYVTFVSACVAGSRQDFPIAPGQTYATTWFVQGGLFGGLTTKAGAGGYPGC